MRKAGWIFISFIVMYIIATIVGFATYLLISPLAMWISVFTLMPVVSALIIYAYLRAMHVSKANSFTETLYLATAWILLSFSFDAATYILILPAFTHMAPAWTFFQDQSPWIWLSYGVLLISAYGGRWLYLRSSHSRSATP